MPINSLASAIRDGQRSIDLAAKDINSQSASLKINKVSTNGGISRLSVTRSFDAEKLSQLLKAAEISGSSKAENELAQEIHTIIGKDTDAASFSGSFKKMMDSLNVSDINNVGARENAIKDTSAFFDKAKHVSNSLQDLATKAEGRVSSTIQDINNLLFKLFNINKNITGVSDQKDNPSRSVAENDLAELAQLIRVKYSSAHGKVMALGSFGGVSARLVDEDSYVKFSYKDGSLTYAFYNESGKVSSDNNLTLTDDSGEYKFNCGGKLEGLIKFESKTLSDLKANIDKSVNEVAEGINIVHNKGVGFPPPTSFTSSKEITSDQKLPGDLGVVEFSPVREDGHYLASSNNRSEILPIKVNTAAATDVSSLIDIINREGEAQSQAGVALGGNVDNDPSKYLIGQVSLQASDISNGSGTIALRLESGSDYDAKVRIKNAVIQDGALNAGVIELNNSWIEVEAGEVQFSPTFNFNIPNAGNQDLIHIAFELETIGSDGTFNTEVVRYTIDSTVNNGLVNFNTGNSYIQADDPAVVAGNWLGVALAPNPATFLQPKANSPIVTADLIDDKFVLGGRVAMVGDNFSEYFGLNDMLVQDSDGHWNINEVIKENHLTLALAQPTKRVVHKDESNLEGIDKAAASFRANGNDIQPHDTITINNVEFTFVAAPATPREVQIGLNDQASLVNLYNLIQSGAFPSVSELVELSYPVNNTMNISAKHSGINGNNIEIDSSIGVGVDNLWRSPRKNNDEEVNSLDGGRSAGRDKAKATFNLAAANPNLNDTITINGFELTFVNGLPANNRQVQIGATPADTITNLNTQLAGVNNYPELTSFLEFTIDNDTLVVEAKEAGTHANNVSIDSFVNGGNVWVTTNAGFLADGTDAMGVREAKRFGLEVTNNNYNALKFTDPVLFSNGLKTLKNAFMDPVIKLQSMLESIESANQVDSEVYDQAMDAFSSDRKIEQHLALIELSKMTVAQRLLFTAQQILMDAEKAGINAISVGA